MSRNCVVCDRTLRTGRKYCYEHRGQKPPKPSYSGVSYSGVSYSGTSGYDVKKWNKKVDIIMGTILFCFIAVVLIYNIFFLQ